jgi:ammonia channel protein AmtB
VAAEICVTNIAIAASPFAANAEPPMKFAAVLLFRAFWLIIVYAPNTHWVWGGCWLKEMRV